MLAEHVVVALPACPSASPGLLDDSSLVDHHFSDLFGVLAGHHAGIHAKALHPAQKDGYRFSSGLSCPSGTRGVGDRPPLPLHLNVILEEFGHVHELLSADPPSQPGRHCGQPFPQDKGLV